MVLQEIQRDLLSYKMIRFCILLCFWLMLSNGNSQVYFRKYIDTQQHCNEFNNQVFSNTDSVFLVNFVYCDSLNEPLSNVMIIDPKGDLLKSDFLNGIHINHYSANLFEDTLFVAGTNNSISPDSKFEIWMKNTKDGFTKTKSLNLFDPNNNDIYLVPIGSIKYNDKYLIYGQYKKSNETKVKSFLLWLNSGLEKDSLMIFGVDKDWSIVSDADIDSQGKLVIIVETVKVQENVEHHVRRILKYNNSKQLLTEWHLSEFYTDQGQSSITILSSGTVIMEFVNNDNESIHSLIAIDTFGSEQWKWEFPSSNPYEVFRIFDLTRDQNDNIIGVGSYRNLNEDIIDAGYLLKLNSDGKKIWDKIYIDKSEINLDSNAYCKIIYFESVTLNEFQDILIGGGVVHDFSKPEENSDIIFLKVNSEGCFGSPCPDIVDISGGDEFLDSNYIWIEAVNNGSITSTKYTIDSEPSLISGKQYFQLLKAESEVSTDWTGTGQYIRYENKIVYTPWLNGEAEVINFNLSVGDTFSVIPPGFDVKLIVDKIDTITLLTGEQRRRWKLRCIDDNPPNIFGYTEWIEGIGNIDGIFATDNMCIFDGSSSEILCMYKNNNLIYDNPDFDSCWVKTTSTKEVSFQTMSLIPNPASNRILISTNNEYFKLTRIYDFLGNLVFEGRTKNIDISKLQDGFYM